MNGNIDKNSLNEFRNLLNKIQSEEVVNESTAEEIKNNKVFNNLINQITQIILGKNNLITEEDAFNIIIHEYFKLIEMNGISEIISFHFKSYQNCHYVIVNDIGYNFDDISNDENASDALNLIDSIIEELNFNKKEKTLKLILKRIEEIINSNNF